MADKVWFSNVSKRDANLLVRWWNAHARPGVTYIRRAIGRGRYNVVRQES